MAPQDGVFAVCPECENPKAEARSRQRHICSRCQAEFPLRESVRAEALLALKRSPVRYRDGPLRIDEPPFQWRADEISNLARSCHAVLKAAGNPGLETKRYRRLGPVYDLPKRDRDELHDMVFWSSLVEGRDAMKELRETPRLRPSEWKWAARRRLGWRIDDDSYAFPSSKPGGVRELWLWKNHRISAIDVATLEKAELWAGFGPTPDYLRWTDNLAERWVSIPARIGLLFAELNLNLPSANSRLEST